jgi:carbon-monoxide dehydrogenase small subunit
MVMLSTALLDHDPTPTDDDIGRALSGNLCRCTGYLPIVQAIRQAAEARRSIHAETTR